MNIDLVGLLKALGDASTYSTITTMVVGGVAALILPLFTISKEKFKEKIELDKEKLLEKLISANEKVFKKIYSPETISIESENDLNKLIIEKVKESIRTNTFTMHLEKLYYNLCRLYNYCFYSIIFATVLLLLSIIITNFKPYATILSMLILITQLVVIRKIINSESRLEDYETKV